MKMDTRERAYWLGRIGDGLREAMQYRAGEPVTIHEIRRSEALKMLEALKGNVCAQRPATKFQITVDKDVYDAPCLEAEIEQEITLSFEDHGDETKVFEVSVTVTEAEQ